jgi:hypothetical protein
MKTSAYASSAFPASFAVGAIAVLWVVFGFLGTNLVALTMTLLIAAVYAFGAYELLQFRRATASLGTALATAPETDTGLEGWLNRLHPTLRNVVRLRIEGERIGLPGPALTPYLAGLLVMLGMLGTFVGMVLTFNGAVFALDGSTDLAAIRAALAAPIKGLGLAFGTSVAGVASSAMLGLMSALVRRERMQVGQALDSQIATALRGYSLVHQRQAAYDALQTQAQLLPRLVDQMQTAMTQMEQMNRQLGETLGSRLLANQENFHGEMRTVYGELARAVGQSLQDSLTQGAQAAGASLKPVVEAAMQGVAQDAQAMHAQVTETAQRQLDGLASRLDTAAATMAAHWQGVLASHERGSAALMGDVGRTLDGFASGFDQRASSLLAALEAAHSRLLAEQATTERQQREAWQAALTEIAATLQREWQQAGALGLAQQHDIGATLARTAQAVADHARSSAEATLGELARLTANAEELQRARIAAETDAAQQHGARLAEMTALLRTELGALREAEAQRGDAAVARLDALQAAVASHLATLGTALEAPIARLMETAAEAPRAAADVIGQLRQEMSQAVARDNALLEERTRILDTLNGLLTAIEHASNEQRATIDGLVANAAARLDQAGDALAARLESEGAKLGDAAAHVAGGAIDVASLGDAFGAAVQAFGAANAQLVENLQRVEAALDKSMSRSEEQLAYYVAQAREVIDLSLLSQKEIFDALRQLPEGRMPAAGAN